MPYDLVQGIWMPSFGQVAQAQTLHASHQLQTIVSSASSGIGTLPHGVSHHPITCTSKLHYEEDGSFACEHCQVPPDDPRTQACIIHSIALLIIEEAQKL